VGITLDVDIHYQMILTLRASLMSSRAFEIALFNNEFMYLL
jgi:hypothetical protein